MSSPIRGPVLPPVRMKKTPAACLRALLAAASLAAFGVSGAPGAPGAPGAARTGPAQARASRSCPRCRAHWERGVFMEIFVRAYQDSDGDGVGDLRGLISAPGLPSRPGHPRPVAHAGADQRRWRPRLRHHRLPRHATRPTARWRTSTSSSRRRAAAASASSSTTWSTTAPPQHPFFVEARSEPAKPLPQLVRVVRGRGPQAGTSGARTLVPHRLAAPWLSRASREDLPRPARGRTRLLLRHLRARTCPTSTCASPRTWCSTTWTACASGSTAGWTATGWTPCRT
jgi:hypothetical protein